MNKGPFRRTQQRWAYRQALWHPRDATLAGPALTPVLAEVG